MLDVARTRIISDKYKQSIVGDLDACLRALDPSGRDISDIGATYEAELARWFDMPHALAVSSGGAALTTAFATLGVGPGDEVVLPPSCPLCTVYPIIQLGATPVFCDTESDGFGLDAAALAAVITARTRAIVEVPMWGYPTRLGALRDAAHRHGIPLVLDLAHAHGSKLDGLHLAAYGDVSCYSTHERKPLATGEGGFMLFRDAETARRARAFTRFGELDGRTFGINHKLSPVQASLGLHRLGHLAEQIARRRANASFITERLTDAAIHPLAPLPGAEPNYYFLLLALPEAESRSVIDQLDRSGVPSDIKRYGCKPLYEFAQCAEYRRDCPQADRMLRTVTTVPVHPGLTQDDLDHIVASIRACRP